MVQLGGLVLSSPRLVPLRMRLLSVFSSLKIPLYLNKEHLIDFYCHTLFLHHFASMLKSVAKCENEKIISQFVASVKSLTKVVTGCLRATKNAISLIVPNDIKMAFSLT